MYIRAEPIEVTYQNVLVAKLTQDSILGSPVVLIKQRVHISSSDGVHAISSYISQLYTTSNN